MISSAKVVAEEFDRDTTDVAARALGRLGQPRAVPDGHYGDDDTRAAEAARKTGYWEARRIQNSCRRRRPVAPWLGDCPVFGARSVMRSSDPQPSSHDRRWRPGSRRCAGPFG